MPVNIGVAELLPARCLQARAWPVSVICLGQTGCRHVSNTTLPPAQHDGRAAGDGSHNTAEDIDVGAMTRRLRSMSEESLETGGRAARKSIQEAGFSEELKRQLEEKIANASFRSENAAAFSQVSMPAGAGKGTRETAAATPWTGTESVEDASLRMLTDVHKPLRGASKLPGIRSTPSKVDTGRPQNQVGSGVRIANARDRSSFYAFAKDAGLSDEERDKFRQQMKQRFQPGARSVPATLQGLASLANERIEDAIARGQFKNLPRGKKIERDYNANSPFINTTEYFMNKIIQKQDIVPPWIEKQQELVATAARFRGRLRADWKRHVARTIASRGGSLESQMKSAGDYARAEEVLNPRQRKVEQINAVDDAGHVSQITIAGDLETSAVEIGSPKQENITIIEEKLVEGDPVRASEQHVTTSPSKDEISQMHAPQSTVPPFRDPKWEEVERSYHTLAVDNLNSLTRSYNLMAPNLAKKPYFSLERELKSCFADVAPHVAAAIKERAITPKIKGVEIVGHTPGGVLEKFSMDKASHVYDERKPQYGFKEFWRDLFSTSKA